LYNKKARLAGIISETKADGIEYECNIIGDGTDENPYRPEIFDDQGYYHFDVSTISGGKCKVWVNKKRTNAATLQSIKSNPKYKKKSETTGGVDIGT